MAKAVCDVPLFPFLGNYKMCSLQHKHSLVCLFVRRSSALFSFVRRAFARSFVRLFVRCSFVVRPLCFRSFVVRSLVLSSVFVRSCRNNPT